MCGGVNLNRRAWAMVRCSFRPSAHRNVIQGQRPTDKPADRLTEQPADRSTGRLTDRPIDRPPGQPTDRPTGQPWQAYGSGRHQR